MLVRLDAQVLQVDAVFQNVAKGELARKAELLRYFGTDDKRACILRILEKGGAALSLFAFCLAHTMTESAPQCC